MKTKLWALILLVFLFSCCRKEAKEMQSDKIVFYGKLSSQSISDFYDHYLVFFKAKNNEYLLLFEVGKFGDFYKEYPKSSGMYEYKIGEKFPIRITDGVVNKDTTIVLSEENLIKIKIK